MTDLDPLEILASVSDLDRDADAAFAERLEAELIAQLDSAVRPAVVTPPQPNDETWEDTTVTALPAPETFDRRWLLAAAAAVILLVVVSAQFFDGDDNSLITDEPTVVTTSIAPEPTTIAPEPTTSSVVETTEVPSEAEPAYSGPLVRMAVLGAELDGELVARSAPGESNEKVRSIFPYSMDLLIAFDNAEEVDGSTWERVLAADGRDLDGWVNADFLINVVVHEDTPEPLFEMASSVRNALLASTPSNRLAERGHTDGLRISLDGSFSEDDPVYESGDLSQVGSDGSVVETEVSAFIEEFVTTQALQQTGQITINRRVRTAEEDNSADFFPGSISVELHYYGDEGSQQSTWESVIMVFLPELRTGATVTEIVEDSTAWGLAGLAIDAPTS